jgi:hypothetical protein
MVADNTFAGVFFALLIWAPIMFLWVAALVDIFRRHDLSGVAIAAWLLLIVLLPIVGTLIYFIARPSVAGGPATSYPDEAGPMPRSPG